jgi:hypothetical protein
MPIAASSVEFSQGSVLALMRLERDVAQLAGDFSKNGGFRQPLLRIGKEVVGPSIAQNFESGGRPAWAPTEAPTEQQYRKATNAGGRPTMMVTKKLYNAAKAFARISVKANNMTYGNFPARAWYGVVLDRASSSQAAGILHHRPFAVWQEEDVNHASEIFMEWVEQKVNQRIRRRY